MGYPILPYKIHPKATRLRVRGAYAYANTGTWQTVLSYTVPSGKSAYISLITLINSLNATSDAEFRILIAGVERFPTFNIKIGQSFPLYLNNPPENVGEGVTIEIRVFDNKTAGYAHSLIWGWEW